MEDVERARLELRREECAYNRGRVIGLDRERLCRLRHRVQPEARACDQREPPARAADEPREVVAGDVLHDLPARARDRPVGQHERHPEHEVAWRAEAVPERARDVLSEERADRGIARRVQREPLSVAVERSLQRRQPHARLDRASQVAGLVLEDAVQADGGQLLTDPERATSGVRRAQQRGGLLEARDARQP